MRLYRVPNSLMIDGFYTSEIIVIATDREQAIEQVGQAVARYIRAELDEYGQVSIGDHWIDPSDEDCDVERLTGLIIASAREEAAERMIEIEDGGFVLRRS